MKTWPVAVAACFLLLAGCAGGLRGNLGQYDRYETASAADGEELSGKRLEELYAKSGMAGGDPGLEAELRQLDQQVKFDVPIQVNRQVKAYLVYFSTERKKIFKIYLARSSRYLPMVRQIFREYGLPEDLAYLAMIESGFNPNACSHAGAVGMWQFIKGTGLRYGLVINGEVDERRDPEKSTRAAARYLQDLYKQFGSWYLAAASYNCGEKRVGRELTKGNHRNFWELSANRCLPSETQNYVPQMIAAAIIAKNPEKFGFRNAPDQPPLAADGLELAQSAGNAAASRRGPETVSRPGRTPESLRVSLAQDAGPTRGRISEADQSGRQPKPHYKSKENQRGQVASAPKSRPGTPRAAETKPTVYVASMLGGPSPSPATPRAIAKKSKTHGRAITPARKGHAAPRVAHAVKKPAPALGAGKNRTSAKKVKVAAKSKAPARNHAGKLARPGSKALLGCRSSQARNAPGG
jgi:soluble lytic murein transglycosylase-like protein